MGFFTPAVIAAGISAGGSLGGGLMGLLGSAGTNNSAAIQANQIAKEQADDARNNERFQQALAVLINQRSTAGTSDSFGSTVKYDPATNTWVSQLGPLPQAEQTAADQAGIRRNTTEQEQAEFANEQAALRAARAGPAADTAQRNLANFRNTPADQLIGLLQNRATTANTETFRPLVADTLRTFARTGTAAGPVLAQLGKANADEVRKSLIDAQISGMTGVDQLNQSRRAGLEQSAANTSTLANPQFQSTGIAPSTQNATLASVLADRAKTASTAPAAGQYGVNQAQQLAQAASKNVQSTLPDPNFGNVKLAQIGNQLGALTNQDSTFMKSLQSMFGGPSAAQRSLSGWTSSTQGNPDYQGVTWG